MKFIIFTGGTHVGKTTVLEYLENKGFTRELSVARKNMECLSSILGDKKYREWRVNNFIDFQKMNIFDEIKLFNDNQKKVNNKLDIIFLDRGIFDWIASLKRESISIPEEIEELVNNIEYYKKVFLFEELEIHETREKTGRMLNKEKSVEWSKYIESEYKNRGYEVIKVPNFKGKNINESIEKRAKFVLNNI